MGLDQPGGKLPLFDRQGRRVPERTIRACIGAGWCEPWFRNPIEPSWLVCKLTDEGRELAVRAVTRKSVTRNAVAGNV